MKKPKPKKPPAWSHPASARCRVAAVELRKIREQQALLAKKAKLLSIIVIEERGGTLADGWRVSLNRETPDGPWWFAEANAYDRVRFLPPVSTKE